MFFMLKHAFLTYQAVPYGSADRLGGPDLRKLFNRFCLYKSYVFYHTSSIFTLQALPYGSADRLGVAELQTKLDQILLYKSCVFHYNPCIRSAFLAQGNKATTCFDHNFSISTAVGACKLAFFAELHTLAS